MRKIEYNKIKLNINGLLFTMFVVFAERTTIDGSDIIRIISARRATKEEKKRYVNGL